MATEEVFTLEDDFGCRDIRRGATLFHRHLERLGAQHLVRERAIAGCIELQGVLQVANAEREEAVAVGSCMAEDTVLRIYFAHGNLGDGSVGTSHHTTDIDIRRTLLLVLCPYRCQAEKCYDKKEMPHSSTLFLRDIGHPP